MKKFLILFCISALFLCTSCTGTLNEASEQSDKITVCTSFYAMYDFTRQIAGDHAQIINLVPSGVEPHDWEPSASDIARLEKADVLIYNGHHMEHWIDKTLASLSNASLITVETASNIPETNDPHVWLDPINAELQMKEITNALCRADNANSAYYTEHYNKCSQKLHKLDDDYQNAGFVKKDIITTHEAYGYLCARYGLTQIAAEGLQGESDPSPARLSEITSFAKEHGIRHVFAENTENTKVADTLAKEINGEVLILDPFETGAKDYFTVMEENLNALKTALGA